MTPNTAQPAAAINGRPFYILKAVNVSVRGRAETLGEAFIRRDGSLRLRLAKPVAESADPNVELTLCLNHERVTS